MSHPLSHNGSVKEAGEFALLALSWPNKEKGRSTLAYFSSPKCSSKKVKFKRERFKCTFLGDFECFKMSK